MYQLGYPALLGIFIVSSVFLFLPSISMSLPSISLSLYFSNLSLPSIIYFSDLSLSSISVSLFPPPPFSFQIRNSLLQVQFPVLDPSLATTHLYNRLFFIQEFGPGYLTSFISSLVMKLDFVSQPSSRSTLPFAG